MPAREAEAHLLQTLVQAAKTQRPPDSRHEADVFRFVAQLVKTRYPAEAKALDSAANNYFAQSGLKPRTFPQVLADGFISDVPRFRHAMENALSGITD